MIILHSGFDGLDLALKASATPELIEVLAAGKAFALDNQQDARATFNGVKIDIGPGGRTGGYTYTFSTGKMGAIWTVKKPNARDPWGVYVSIRSRALAIDGLEKVRADLDETCQKLGFRVPPDGVSIGRADFAVDILAPGFVLDPSGFVMHSRTNRKDITEFDGLEVNGHSGRVTSVTAGKMPGRQVIVYDKRDEVLARRKHEWPVIWNAALKEMSVPLTCPPKTPSP